MAQPLYETDPPLRLLAAFQQLYPTAPPEHVVQAPGRATWVAVTNTSAQHYTFHAPDYDGRVQFTYRSAIRRRTTLNRPLPSWARYPAGVIVTMIDQGYTLPIVNAVVVSDVPSGPAQDYGLGLAFAAMCCTISGQHCLVDDLQTVVDLVRREFIAR